MGRVLLLIRIVRFGKSQATLSGVFATIYKILKSENRSNF